jgi:hypothetical protein
MRSSFSIAALFLIVVTLYLCAGVSQLADSKFTMVLSQTLIEKGSFRIDTLLPVGSGENLQNISFPQELVVINGHLYYLYPNATSLLSVPYLAFFNFFGIYPLDNNYSWNRDAETRIQRGEASILSALFVCMVFVLARWLLNERYAWFFSLTAAGGTQLLSITSRAMWSHTLGIFLLGLVILMLVKAETTKRLNPFLLATLLSWMYFVRPSHNINILAVSIFVFVCYRGIFLRYILTGFGWLTLIVSYSLYNFGTLLPRYFKTPGEVGNPHFLLALAGNLISPSRGVLIFSPFWIVVIYLLVKYRQQLRFRALAILAGGVSFAQYVLGSVFLANWWGGHCFGPRMMTDFLPWLILLAILAVDAYRMRMEAGGEKGTFEKGALISLTIVLVSFSFFTHGVGAFRPEAHGWNVAPLNIDKHPERIWDWYDPQFLRGVMTP